MRCKKQRNLVFSLILLVMVSNGLRSEAQVSKQFSQYVFSGLTINPAYAGYNQDWTMNTFYRQQWAGVPGSPTTATVTMDGLANIRDERMALGLEFSSEKLGAESVNDIYGSYAYRLAMNGEGTSRLCFGLGLGLSQYSINGSLFQSVDTSDPSVPLGKVSTVLPNARFGIYYYTPTYYIGASLIGLFSFSGAKQYMQGTNTFYGTIKGGHQLYLTAGAILKISEDVNVKPSVLISEDFTGNTNIDLNLFLLLQQKLWLGASYRQGVNLTGKVTSGTGLQAVNSMSAMFEYYFNENVRIGYSYDFTTSGISGYQSGSNEISLGLTFYRKRKPGIICPHFF